MTTVKNAAPLSDDEIERLLQEAEDRLREREQGQDGKSLIAKPAASQQLLKPETDATPFNAAHTTTTSGSPSVKKPELSVRAPGRELTKQEKVRHMMLSYYLLKDYMKKIFPNFIEAATYPVMGDVVAPE